MRSIAIIFISTSALTGCAAPADNSTKSDDAENTEGEERDPSELAPAETLAEELLRDDVAEQELHQPERADVDGRFEREGREPQAGGERPHEPGEQRDPPGAENLDDDGKVAQGQPAAEQQRLQCLCRGERIGGRERGRGFERKRGAATAGCRQGEHRARGETE